MSTPYTVKSGDFLIKIAGQFGIADWRTIYDHADNAAFRRKRPDPNKIFPGDVLMIPDQGPAPPPPAPTPPPPAPTPTLPSPFARLEDAQKAVRAYLAREARRDVLGVLRTQDANMIVLGETHFTFDRFKSALFAGLVGRLRIDRPIQTQFHASERFTNDTPTRDQISTFLGASPADQDGLAVRLNSDLKPFLSLLRAAAGFPGRRFGVVPIQGSPNSTEDVRHKALFDGFVDGAARCPDVPPRSINNATSRGTILLGARHAARLHVAGRPARTTCALLGDAGWKIHAVRLTVPFDTTDATVPEDEDLGLRASSETRALDLIAIAQDVAGGAPFYADLTKDDSPFKFLREVRNGAADIAYNTLFDALIHLPSASFPSS